MTTTDLASGMGGIILGYVLLGIFIATLAGVLINRFGLVKLTPSASKGLILALAIEGVLLASGWFGNFLKINPEPVRTEIQDIVYKSRVEPLEKRVFELAKSGVSIRIADESQSAMAEILADGLKSRGYTLGTVSKLEGEPPSEITVAFDPKQTNVPTYANDVAAIMRSYGVVDPSLTPLVGPQSTGRDIEIRFSSKDAWKKQVTGEIKGIPYEDSVRMVEDSFRKELGYKDADIAGLNWDSKLETHCDKPRLHNVREFIRTDGKKGLPGMDPKRTIKTDVLDNIGGGTSLASFAFKVSESAYYKIRIP